MSKGKIAIIDDNEIFRSLVSGALKESGFETQEFSDGQNVVKTILESKPDLILLDQMLPDIDGISILLEIRKDDWGKNVPVFALTQSEAIGRVAGNLKLGVTKYLIKDDNSIDKIVELVEEALKNKIS